MIKYARITDENDVRIFGIMIKWINYTFVIMIKEDFNRM